METMSIGNLKMRRKLIDWLIDVHMKFKLLPETLFLTVNIIDRYCERNQVKKKNYQLLGVTSMLIASKYEEIYPPELRDLVYICDKAYTENDVSNLLISRSLAPILVHFVDAQIHISSLLVLVDP